MTGSIPFGRESSNRMERDDPAETGRELQTGDVFAGRYKVLALVGRGRTSEVYKVRDQLANAIIALKLVRSVDAGDPRILAGFQRELALTRKFLHPDVTFVFDIGVHGRLFYIVMEYVEGRTLADHLTRAGRLSLPAFLTLLNDFCRVLDQVHPAKVIHRDIKPSNVMLTPTGRLKLMDFGLAKEIWKPLE